MVFLETVPVFAGRYYRFSTVPLTMAALLGALFCVLAFGMIVFIIVKTLIFGDPTSGWPSLVCIIMLVSGVQLFCLGIVANQCSSLDSVVGLCCVEGECGNISGFQD